MGGNDTFNDCTETCCANAYILHATLAGNPVAMEDAEVERFDSILTGFNPHEGDDQVRLQSRPRLPSGARMDGPVTPS